MAEKIERSPHARRTKKKVCIISLKIIFVPTSLVMNALIKDTLRI